MVMATRQNCTYNKEVAKAKSLGCYSCGTFFHFNCTDVHDNDLRVFTMKKPDFKWSCVHCEAKFSEYKDTILNKQTRTELKDALMSEVSWAFTGMASDMAGVNNKLNNHENRASI